jgi:hypothetical protein
VIRWLCGCVGVCLGLCACVHRYLCVGVCGCVFVVVYVGVWVGDSVGA